MMKLKDCATISLHSHLNNEWTFFTGKTGSFLIEK